MSEQVLLAAAVGVAVGAGLAGVVWFIRSRVGASGDPGLADHTSPDVRDPGFHSTQMIDLWRYLHEFADGPSMPDADAVKAKFGPPQDHIGMDIVTSAFSRPTAETFYRFNDDDGDCLSVTGLRYYNEEGRWRSIDVVIRDRDGSVVGWDWFENVPPGKEIGPPPL